MASLTFRRVFGSSTDTNTITCLSFTPAANDLLIVIVSVAAFPMITSPVLSDSQGKTWTLIDTIDHEFGAGRDYVYIATTKHAASGTTVTFSATGTWQAVVGAVHSAAGMTNTGASAVRQTAESASTGSSITHEPTFAVACLTTSAVLGWLGQESSSIVVTPPSGWTETAAQGFSSPNCGIQTVARDNGFTGTAVTWGSSEGNARALVIELDPGAPPVTGTHTPTLDAATQTASGEGKITGTHASTLDAATQDASGLSAPSVTGAAASTLDGVTHDGTGEQKIEGAHGTSLDSATQDASGAQKIEGASASTLSELAHEAEGTVAIEGAAATTLDSATQSASGFTAPPVTGTMTNTLGDVTQQAEASNRDEFIGPQPVISQIVQPSLSVSHDIAHPRYKRRVVPRRNPGM